MKKVVLNDRKSYYVLGTIGKPVLEGRDSKNPVDAIVKRIVSLLKKHDLKNEVTGLVWADESEEKFKSKTIAWCKKHRRMTDQGANLAYAMTSLDILPLEMSGLSYNTLYVRAGSANGRRLARNLKK
jgi:hypothetical protein